MTDLRNRISTHLSGTYSLERELGGGGMSRVFIAEETALGRKVVVKVMSPELAEGLSAERFVREIKVAARLQQANIVPVLRAGELDGLPYYTMPFVTGESLRSRMDQGAASPGDAIGILRDVARALAYAHGEGIVHRDIKPENVLLSAGTAVVTDFGIAKAISDSRQDVSPGATLTSVGTSLGTPAYMAPEQAVGDPNTDARADLYAWGVMAYEMLAGRHPFAQHKTAHDLIRAHVTETPEHVAVRAAGAPMGVCNLVMACLAKAPEDRPGSASDLVAVLEGAQGPMEGAAPSGPLGLFKAIGLYAAAFVAVALLAQLSTALIGLPTWVFPGAMGVMIVGLPIVLVTALLERQRHVHATSSRVGSGTLARIAVEYPRRFTWRRTSIGGGIALTIFVAAVAGYMLTRQLGIGPFGTLIGSNALAARDRIVIADMRGPASDSGLGAVFAEGLRAGLSESNVIRLVATSRVGLLLQQMQRPGAQLTGDVAREVATRAGAKAILEGDVGRVGSAYALSVRLLPASGGDPLVQLQETAESDADFTSATGRLARKLRERVGESLRSLNAAPELPDVTTASLPALRKFTEALRAEYRGDYPAAFQAAREAIGIDSGFASAYRYLGTTLSAVLSTRQFQSEMAERAYAMRDRATPYERAEIEKDYWFAGPNPDRERMRQAAEAMYAIDPERAALVMADASFHVRDYPRVISRAHEALAFDSASADPYWYLALAHAELGQVDSAGMAVERYRTGSQNQIGAFLMSIQFASLMENDSVALAMATQLRHSVANPFVAEVGATILRGLQRRAGRLRDSWETVRFEEGVSTARQMAAARGFGLLYEAIDRALFLDDVRGASRLIDEAERRFPQESLPPRERYTDDFMMAAYYAQRPELIRRMMESLKRHDPNRAQPGGGSNMLAQAETYLALLEGRHADAVAAVHRSDIGPQPRSSLVRIAKVFDRTGPADSAMHYYERYLNSTSLYLTIWSDGMDLALARRRLAQLYEERQEYTKAYDMYSAFAHQWRDADPELQPLVRSARARMTALERLRAQ